MPDITRQEFERIFRDAYGRAVAVLVRRCGSIDAAEEAVQDAFLAALARWPSSGIPPSPVGWIITTARNRAIDQLRREMRRDDRHREADALLRLGSEVEAEAAVPDDRLRLIFTCCHPALAPAARVALTLRLVGGLTTAEIARAFLVAESTMAQRLVRAKAKIRDAGIPYRVPTAEDLPERLRGVLSVIYLVFNEGYATSSGAALMRLPLCDEAIRLGRQLADLLPHEPEVIGLLAMMLLSHSRSPARLSAEGGLVPLAMQDRSLWRSDLIAEGQALVQRCLAINRPGPYQIQAAIHAVHSDAPDYALTDWGQIVQLYDQLLVMSPGAVVAVNRAVAIAEARGPASGLAILDELEADEYYLFHAVRADLLRRLGQSDEAVAACDRAIARCGNGVERAFLQRQRSMAADAAPVVPAAQPRAATSSS